MIAELEKYLYGIAPHDWRLENASDDRFGDYATNVAFRLAKSFGKSPLVVSEELAIMITQFDKGRVFSRVVAAAPGFLNFTVAHNYVAAQLERVLEEKQDNTSTSSGIKKINIEFISANPTGPLTMANGRGGFFGDVLANVLEAVGHDVTREYYVNDAGVQIRRLGESVAAALELLPKNEEQYQGSYIGELAQKFEAKITSIFKKKGAEEVGRIIAADLLKQIKKSLKRAGITFDLWFSEYKDLRKKKMLEKTLDLLRSLGKIEVREGATWLGERVLVKSDGEPTYLLADIAHHYIKFFDHRVDESILVLGADHHGYVAPLRAGIEALGVSADRFHPIIAQLVRLVRDGEEVRMSKRKGEFITLNELVDEVGVDTTRFFFLSIAMDSHMDFDLTLAKERSMKNPVYYVQYAYVRCRSILQKIKAKSEKLKTTVENLKLLQAESEMRLMKVLVQFPDMLLRTARDYQVHRLTQYAQDLARHLHHFYESEKVIGDDVLMTEARLALVVATKHIFEQLFAVLGVGAPKKM